MHPFQLMLCDATILAMFADDHKMYHSDSCHCQHGSSKRKIDTCVVVEGQLQIIIATHLTLNFKLKTAHAIV